MICSLCLTIDVVYAVQGKPMSRGGRRRTAFTRRASCSILWCAQSVQCIGYELHARTSRFMSQHGGSFCFFTTSRAVSGPPTYPMGNGAFHQGPNSWGVTLITDRYLVQKVLEGVELYVRKMAKVSCRRLQYLCIIFVLYHSQVKAEFRYDSIVSYSDLMRNKYIQITRVQQRLSIWI